MRWAIYEMTRELKKNLPDVPDEFPYWDDIVAHYPPSKVALIDGDDWAQIPCVHWLCVCERERQRERESERERVMAVGLKCSVFTGSVCVCVRERERERARETERWRLGSRALRSLAVCV